jgi:4-hydroxybenzoate polyprenyltransferase/geranylgeranylglycerol-phosphate geranylgeranyltransferase
MVGERLATPMAHLQTWRPYTLWYVGLLGLGGAGLTPDARGWRLAAAWAAPTLGWVSGHYLGDFFDRRLDAIAKPHRPIPSGRLSPRSAVTSGFLCLLAVLVLAAASGWATLLVALAAAGAIVAYSRMLKARGFAGNLIRGALGAMVLVFGALETGHPAGWALLFFAVACWTHDTCSNLVGTLRDIAGDRAGGYQTLPVRRGSSVAVATAVALYAITVLAALAGGLMSGRPDRAGFLILLAAVAVTGCAALALLVIRHGQMEVRAALRAHEVLVVERLGFAATVISLGLGVLTAVTLLVMAVPLTWWTQSRMRAGYELGPAASRDGPDPADESPPAELSALEGS